VAKGAIDMLKYASKLFLKMSLSVLATVIGAYVANHYVGGKSPADVSALFVSTKAELSGNDMNVASRATEKANPPPPVHPSSTANTSQVTSDAGERLLRTVDDKWASGHKEGMPIDKRVEVANLAIRPQSRARDTRISRANKAAVPAAASSSFATARSQASSEQVRSAREDSSTGSVLQPREADRDDAVPLPLEWTRKDTHFVGRILEPVMHKALLLLRKPAELLRHEGDQEERSLYERLASSAIRSDASEGRSF
jgi:hypothetical protein